MSLEAATARQKMLTALAVVVNVCVCEWPLVKYRNGDGHDSDCPAHVDIGSRGNRRP